MDHPDLPHRHQDKQARTHEQEQGKQTATGTGSHTVLEARLWKTTLSRAPLKWTLASERHSETRRREATASGRPLGCGTHGDRHARQESHPRTSSVRLGQKGRATASPRHTRLHRGTHASISTHASLMAHTLPSWHTCLHHGTGRTQASTVLLPGRVPRPVSKGLMPPAQHLREGFPGAPALSAGTPGAVSGRLLAGSLLCPCRVTPATRACCASPALQERSAPTARPGLLPWEAEGHTLGQPVPRPQGDTQVPAFTQAHLLPQDLDFGLTALQVAAPSFQEGRRERPHRPGGSRPLPALTSAGPPDSGQALLQAPGVPEEPGPAGAQRPGAEAVRGLLAPGHALPAKSTPFRAPLPAPRPSLQPRAPPFLWGPRREAAPQPGLSPRIPQPPACSSQKPRVSTRATAAGCVPGEAVRRGWLVPGPGPPPWTRP